MNKNNNSLKQLSNGELFIDKELGVDIPFTRMQGFVDCLPHTRHCGETAEIPTEKTSARSSIDRIPIERCGSDIDTFQHLHYYQRSTFRRLLEYQHWELENDVIPTFDFTYSTQLGGTLDENKRSKSDPTSDSFTNNKISFAETVFPSPVKEHFQFRSTLGTSSTHSNCCFPLTLLSNCHIAPCLTLNLLNGVPHVNPVCESWCLSFHFLLLWHSSCLHLVFVYNHGGQFLKKEKQRGKYCFLMPKETQRKTSQALWENEEMKWALWNMLWL